MAFVGLVGMFNLIHFVILTTLTLTLDLCYEYSSPLMQLFIYYYDSLDFVLLHASAYGYML